MDFLGGDPSARAMEDYLPPLYFQHNGHSRTIIGYETAKDKTSLFVFDPSQRGDTIKRSEEHTSELQSLMRISYAVFCLKKKTQQQLYQNSSIEHINSITL